MKSIIQINISPEHIYNVMYIPENKVNPFVIYRIHPVAHNWKIIASYADIGSCLLFLRDTLDSAGITEEIAV